ncbi:MAG: class I SAM-dependent methyltransferase [Bacteroidia bacterium]|nr:class I SAM-dependent methyltransferase [Bacteroidia bacterium]
MESTLIQAWGIYLFRLGFLPSSPRLSQIAHLYRRLLQARGYQVRFERIGASFTEEEWGTYTILSLSELTRRGATPPWKGRLLYDLVRQAAPSSILELGTHLGIGTLYLAAAAPQATLHTVEGSSSLATWAKRHFRLFGIRPFLHVGLFSEVLPKLSGPWSLVYIDGDHRGEALYKYGSYLYEYITPRGWLICDDIFWSRDMFRGWLALGDLAWQKKETIGPFGILQR